MAKRQPNTTNSQIRAALRRLFLRSRERAARLKQDKYCCQRCFAKQSKKKGFEVSVEVHHREGVENWTALFEAVRKFLLCDPALLETLCAECHKAETERTWTGFPDEPDVCREPFTGFIQE
jgi:5-methylcytosine-specific restriction endonuclease McrA